MVSTLIPGAGLTMTLIAGVFALVRPHLDELRAGQKELKSVVENGQKELRTEFKTEMKEVKTEVKKVKTEMKAEMKLMKDELLEAILGRRL